MVVQYKPSPSYEYETHITVAAAYVGSSAQALPTTITFEASHTEISLEVTEGVQRCIMTAGAKGIARPD